MLEQRRLHEGVLRGFIWGPRRLAIWSWGKGCLELLFGEEAALCRWSNFSLWVDV